MNIDALAVQASPAANTASTSPQSSSTQQAASAHALEAAKSAVAKPSPSLEAVKAAAQQIDSYLKSVGRSLEFSVDSGTGETVIRVRDASTGDLIRQIPSEEALQLARSLGRSGSALLNEAV